MHANTREDVDEAYAGDIVAAVGLKHTRTGDTLCDEDDPIILEKMTFPDPVIHVAIEPKTKADQEKMGEAIAEAARRRSDAPRVDQRRDRPDDHQRDGRAASGDHHRPDEARIQGRGEHRQAAGRLQGDDPEEGARRKGSSSASRAGAVSTATSGSKSSRTKRGRGSSSRTRSSAASSRRNTSSRSSRGSWKR